MTFYVSSIAFLLKTRLLRRIGFQNALLSALCFITTLLLAEIAYTAMNGLGTNLGSDYVPYQVNHWRPNARYTYCGIPAYKNEFCVTHQNNSLGYNDEEHGVDKPPGVYRILVLGDSFVEAFQVKLENTFHKVLEARLNEKGLEVEVLAMGKSGWGAVRALEALEEEGLAYEPDLVILEFLGGNDVRDSTPNLAQQYLKGRKETWLHPELKKFLLGRFDLSYYFVASIDRLYKRRQEPIPFDFQVYDPQKYEVDPSWSEAWEITFDAIQRMKRISEANGAALLVVSFTSKWEIASYEGQPQLREALQRGLKMGAFADRFDFQLPDKVMADFTREADIHYLQLNPLFANIREREGPDVRFHWVYDGHRNERGHQEAAEAIRDYLDSHFSMELRR